MQKKSVESILSSMQADENGIYKTGMSGYWSNLSQSENTDLVDMIKSEGAKRAVKSKVPHLFEMIYNSKREAILELLDIDHEGTCLDYGCMWGVLSVGAAKRTSHVIAIDQTYESLFFLKKRCEEEGIKNISPVQGDINQLNFEDVGNYAIVNGVLEWIAVQESVEVNSYYQGNKKKSENSQHPQAMQLNFLKKVNNSLVAGGKLALAIENRHSYQYYMGMRDPHANLLYTTFLPRFIANIISKIFKKRPYRTYIYSFKDLKELLRLAGFKNIQLYSAFPNYHFPELILDYSKKGITQYQRYPNINRITIKQKIAYGVEILLMKVFKARWFAPAIMVIAEK